MRRRSVAALLAAGAGLFRRLHRHAGMRRQHYGEPRRADLRRGRREPRGRLFDLARRASRGHFAARHRVGVQARTGARPPARILGGRTHRHARVALSAVLQQPHAPVPRRLRQAAARLRDDRRSAVRHRSRRRVAGDRRAVRAACNHLQRGTAPVPRPQSTPQTLSARRLDQCRMAGRHRDPELAGEVPMRTRRRAAPRRAQPTSRSRVAANLGHPLAWQGGWGECPP